ncbi:MAG: L-histidine N(alpha)-methyltransferase [Bacteroidales bacterium]|nr:L-histidine N(alpha)-methyltransferase [Bacteroidales bacterium]
MEIVIENKEFAQDVESGLSAKNKYLSSKYFYDDEGSRIFQDIMQMPEYYLTDCELEIFQEQKQSIYESFTRGKSKFELIELGAGDGLKTKVLLSYFLVQDCEFEYAPIDISEEAIVNLLSSVKEDFPLLNVNGRVGDYFVLLDDINRNCFTQKVLLFLGSNIGNFQEEEALFFLRKLHNVMHKDDLLLIGFDLKKEAHIILDAYNDSHGHTAKFNLNLLKRINRELGADFDIAEFKHRETYNSESGLAKSELVSLSRQEVKVKALNKMFYFEKEESIFMEVSQKYDAEYIMYLANQSGFEIVQNFSDKRQYFTNSLWQIK